MSEFRPADPSDYMSDINDIAVDISTIIFRGANIDGGISVTIDPRSDEVLDSSGYTTAGDILIESPDFGQEEALELEETYRNSEEAGAKMRVINLSAALTMHAFAQEAKRLSQLDLNMPSEILESELDKFSRPEPTTAVSRKAVYEHHADGAEMALAYTALLDDERAPLASSYLIDLSDGNVTKSFAFVFIGPRLAITHVDTHLVGDELKERAGKLLNWTDFGQANAMMAGLSPSDEEELEEKLNNIWLNYQGTSKETEVGPILDEIRDRYLAAADAREVSRQLGSQNSPSLQELVELREYLS